MQSLQLYISFKEVGVVYLAKYISLNKNSNKVVTVFICIKAGLICIQGFKYMQGSAAEWIK